MAWTFSVLLPFGVGGDDGRCRLGVAGSIFWYVTVVVMLDVASSETARPNETLL